MDTFAGLDWDDGNLAKCQKHGVSVDEIAAMFAAVPRYSPDVKHSEDEQRFIAVGHNPGGRPMFVVFTVRERNGRRYVRPISARYMHAREATRHGNA